MTFDAYHKWLGIPSAEQPPHHYRLLGITLYESDPDVIEGAADRQMSHVRTFQSGQYSVLSQQILNELAAAKLCLLHPQKKAAYDADLRGRMDTRQPGQQPVVASYRRPIDTGSQDAADWANHVRQPAGAQQEIPERTLVDREGAGGLETTIDHAKAPHRGHARRRLSAPRIQPKLTEHPDYEIVKELGRGGMGVVYLAKNRLMDRLEVLKVLNNSLLERPGALVRFQQEIRSAAKLSHVNIVGAYAVIRMGDSLVFAMEYVPGQDLAQIVGRRGPLRVPNATYYVHQAALGLQHAHEKKMVHRDIKPNNLMLAVDGKKHIVKVLDFGLAKATSEKDAETGLTKSGQILGTPDYLAPEQSRDAQRADIRADIYSLGCTLYFLLSGKRPFPEASLYDVLDAHQRRTAVPLDQVRPDVPPELAAVVAKMMAKAPADRYQTPVEVAKVLLPFFKPSQSPSPLVTARDNEEFPQYTMNRALSEQPVATESRSPAAPVGPATALSFTPPRAVPIVVPISQAAFEGSIDFETPFIDSDHGLVLVAPWPRWRLYLATCLAAVLVMLGVAALHKRSSTLAPLRPPRAADELSIPAAIHTESVEAVETMVPEVADAPRTELTESVEAVETMVPEVADAPRTEVTERFAFEIPDPHRARWSLDGDELVQSALDRGIDIIFGDPDWSDFDFSVEFLRIAGGGSCAIRFASTDGASTSFFDVAGRRNELSVIVANDGAFRHLASHAGSINSGTWYRLKLSLRGNGGVCFVDNEQMAFTAERPLQGRVGLCTWGSACRFRNLLIKAVDGKVLLKGLPRLDAEPPRRLYEETSQKRLAERGGTLPLADSRPLNLGFETGNLQDWTVTGHAFDDQPVEGDTLHARYKYLRSRHSGRYWIRGGETQSDSAKGTLTSRPFKVTHPYASFLVAGGGIWTGTCVELVRADTKQPFARVLGQGNDKLSPVAVDLREQLGKEIMVRIVDDSDQPWGRVSFDDFRFHETKPKFYPHDALPSRMEAGAQIDVLNLIDISRDYCSGQWAWDKRSRLLGSGGGRRLELPVPVPLEYDLMLTVEGYPRAGEIKLNLHVGGFPAELVIDGWGKTSSGLRLFDGRESNDNETTHRGAALRGGQPNKLRCEVRTNSLRLVCNDETVIDWHGDPARLSLGLSYHIAGYDGLLIGGEGSGFAISQIDLMPVTLERIDNAQSVMPQTIEDGRELLRNPSCEEPLRAGQIPGWVAVKGQWAATETETPQMDGSGFFRPLVNAEAELQQDVALAPFADKIMFGDQWFSFSGHVRSYPHERPDTARIVIEYRDQSNTKILESADSGPIASVSSWKLFADTRRAPKEARFVRVRLLSTRNVGNDNDGYYDNLSLRAVPGPAGYLADKLEQTATVSFVRNTLENALALLADQIGVEINLLGEDLRAEEITKTQSLGLNERDQAAGDILRKILQRANPDGKLVYVIKPKPGTSDGAIYVTTRAAAQRRGDTLPADLQAPPQGASATSIKVTGSPAVLNDPGFQKWLNEVSSMHAQEQIEAVKKELRARNPSHRSGLKHKIADGAVTEVSLSSTYVTDLSPIRALSGLKVFSCRGAGKTRGGVADLSALSGMRLSRFDCWYTKVADLSPLKGMPLTSLDCGSTMVTDLSPLAGMPLTNLQLTGLQITDLSPLKGMPLVYLGLPGTSVSNLSPLAGLPLQQLNIQGTKVSDLSPLVRMPLHQLRCGHSPLSDLAPLRGLPLFSLSCGSSQVADLGPLAGMPLTSLDCYDTKVADLGPLQGMRLTNLDLRGTQVSDISPLKGMPLRFLSVVGAKVTDLSPLKDSPLTSLYCDFKLDRDSTVLGSIKTLKQVNGMTPEMFWKRMTFGRK